MTYQQSLDYIHSLQKFGSKPGLERIRRLTDKMGNPEKKLKFVHITGTNGKGSTAVMAESVLRSAGYKTGLFISPYLENFRERIQISRSLISEQELAGLAAYTKEIIDAITRDGYDHPTEFEAVTAMGLCHFARQKCDIVILEVGMGGGNDSTNIISGCEAAVFTPIALDHAKWLGQTVFEIAREKSGIIKPGCPTVCCSGQSREALEAITFQCSNQQTDLFVPDISNLRVFRADLSGSQFTWQNYCVNVPLAGEHQIQNTITVIELIRVLRQRGWDISDDALLQGIENVKWRGRLEVTGEHPLRIIDGAHNPAAIEVLSAAIDKFLTGRRLIAVMAMSLDKKPKSCVAAIASRASVFIATQVRGISGALPAEDVARLARSHCPEVLFHRDTECAINIALSRAGEDDVILACGSLYMIGRARGLLTK
ncbi:MAG: bifunctional folylpolyglutamate synthase/dihydrofolate synthase [Oscillospiraceae bacterium]|nr:bifunctional folylpolyglutamate synthase/dihydrofolate synthase [Oscillospiraceae bacterium]